MLEKTNAHGYRIREDGRIVSPLGKILKPSLQRNGRYTVGCKEEGRWYTRYVHQLVCEAFGGPRPDGQEVRHLDGDCTNNYASNLQWGTRAENERDKDLHGRRRIGTAHHNARLDPNLVRTIRSHISWGATKTNVARSFGVSETTITKILNGTTWRHVQ